MKFLEYAEEAHKTAIYPLQTNNFGLAYLSLKLCGEANELYNAHQSGTSWESMQEAGDVLWYISQIAKTLSIDIDTDLEEKGMGDSVRAPFYILKSACLIAEHTGKIYREAREDTINYELTFFKAMILDILRQLTHLASGLNTSLAAIAELNIYKLSGRKKRGTLNGSGNDR